MRYRIQSVEAIRYPVVCVTFDDGLSGEYDLGPSIAEGPIFAPLKDETYFRTVQVAPDGHSFGWNLGELGQEIDFCPDSVRIQFETRLVEEMAGRHAARRSAAE